MSHHFEISKSVIIPYLVEWHFKLCGAHVHSWIQYIRTMNEANKEDPDMLMMG